jgi:signal transduction histidine kinase
MQPSNYHQLLAGQIRETLGEPSGIPAPVQALLQKVSDTYGELDDKHKQAEEKVRLRTEQLMASTSRAYSFLDSLNMGFVMCDVTAEVVLTNRAVRRIFASKDTDNPQPGPADDTEWTIDAISALIQPKTNLKELVQQCLTSHQPLELKDVSVGNRALHWFLAPMLSEGGQGDTQQLGAIILVEDITEQKVLEHSKDEFLSIASHELRTPLTAIRGNTSLIKQYYFDRLPDKDVAEMVDDIHESAVRLIDIVNDFLDVSALEQGKISMKAEAFPVGETIGEIVHEMQNLCTAKGITLQSDPDTAAAPAVMADKRRIKQVLYNLVGNAAKFTDQGGITVGARADDNFVYVTVKDTGRGIPPENQQLLFRKFQQAGGGSLLTRDTTKGTGLGLYISKLIIELSGGKIGLESSKADQGSAFTFSLPRANG